MLVLPEQNRIQDEPLNLAPQSVWIGGRSTDVLGLEPPTAQLSSGVCVTAGGWRAHLGCLAMVKV